MPKYISLKEAAELSGYTPDYLGQLIRKGKLPGKQVYLNVAWMTTEEALKDYLDLNKIGGVKLGFARTVKKKIRRWIVVHTSGDRLILLARRIIYFLIAVLMLFCLFLIYALFANLMH